MPNPWPNRSAHLPKLCTKIQKVDKQTDVHRKHNNDFFKIKSGITSRYMYYDNKVCFTTSECESSDGKKKYCLNSSFVKKVFRIKTSGCSRSVILRHAFGGFFRSSAHSEYNFLSHSFPLLIGRSCVVLSKFSSH